MFQNYGETLKKRRRARGITLVELAARIEVSQTVLANIELGIEEPTSEQRQKIEKFLRRARII